MSKIVGVVGLGAMGSAFAIMLVKAGFEVVGFDVRAAALDELESNGGKRAGSPRDVAEQSDVVLLSLPSIEVFQDVISGQGSVTSSGKAGLVVIDTCTMPIAVDRVVRTPKDTAECPASMATLCSSISAGSGSPTRSDRLSQHAGDEKVAYGQTKENRCGIVGGAGQAPVSRTVPPLVSHMWKTNSLRKRSIPSLQRSDGAHQAQSNLV